MWTLMLDLTFIGFDIYVNIYILYSSIFSAIRPNIGESLVWLYEKSSVIKFKILRSTLRDPNLDGGK